MNEPAEKIPCGQLYDLAEWQATHPPKPRPPKKKILDLGPEAPIFRRLIAAIQSQSFLPNQAEELAKALSEKFGICPTQLTADGREKMRERTARRQLKKIQPGEAAILVALAKHELKLREAIRALRWLEAMQ